MPALTLQFLGAFEVRIDAATVARFRSTKVRALLAYLAVEADRPHQRASLAALLWPNQADALALNNLSQTLVQLRTAIGDAQAVPPLLHITRQTIQWNGQSTARIDVTTFSRLARSTVIADLEQAVALYRGMFLPGFNVPDCTDYDEWLLLTREHLERRAAEVLDRLARTHLAAGSYAEAEAAARRQLALDPWREAAHRQVMAALVGAGQRNAALAHFAACRRTLAAELGIEPDDATTALYVAIKDGAWQPPATDEPAAALPTRTHGAPTLPATDLPTPLTTILGRDHELTQISGLLADDGERLVTLVGAGGVGKTRLALEVAWRLRAQWPAVVWVPLVGIGDHTARDTPSPDDTATWLATALAGALALTLVDTRPVTAQVIDALRAQRLLVVLDNMEHLVAGTPWLLDLLRHAPRVHLLVTSRERLNVAAEVTLPLDGLLFPVTDDDPAAASYSSIQLFLERARRVVPGFSLAVDELPAVARLCRLLEGLPLGLELAAHWVAHYSIVEIADGLVNNLDLVATTRRDYPQRHRGLRSVFDYSWQLLPPTEQQALARLSVFRGAFSREAAQHVAQANVAVLAALVDKSLLRQAGVGRYAIHELLRQFGAEQIDAVPDARAEVAARHGAYYLRYVATRARRLGRDEPREAATEIRGEIDNVRQAWEWAVAERQVSELARAAYGWWQFCLQTGQYAESRRAFGLAAGRFHATFPAARSHDKAMEPPRGWSTLLAINANHLFSFVPFEDMATEAREAIRLGVASGDVEGETLGTFVLGRALQELRQHAEARAMWERTVALVRSYQPRDPESELLHEVEWMACLWLIGVSLFFEDYPGGRAWGEEALRIARALGKRRAQVSSLANLATINVYTGDDLVARERLEEALRLARALEDRWRELGVQRDLGELFQVQGAYTQARTALLAALAAAREMGNLYDEIRILAGLVRLHCQLGDLASAARWRDELVARVDGPGVTLDCQAEGLRACAVLALHQGRYEQALADAEHASRVSAEIDIPNHRADSAVILGHTRAAMDQPDAAAAYQQAADVYQKLGNTPLASEPRAGLARLALARGDRAQARTLIDAILPVLDERPRAGVLTPFYAYLICYHVLAANGDVRAEPLVRTARRRLWEAADQIADPDLRQLFLENVVAHRELARIAVTHPIDAGEAA